jgi:AraC-like DNA-binding protein
MRLTDLQTVVATVVEPADRARFDAVADGRFATIHAESVADAIRAVRERPVGTVVLSAGYVPRDQVASVASLVKTFPGVPAVAVVARHDARSSERLLDLGASGVRRVVDLSARDGWQRLRDVVAHPATPLSAAILAAVMPELDESPPDCRLCFQSLIRVAPETSTVRAFCRRVGVRPSTLMSRFFRARLPSPKRYLSGVRLIYVAALLEVRGLSVADVAYRLEYSSPQSFGRHLRALTGLTPSEYRRRTSFSTSIERFRTELVVPYRAVFRYFHPFNNDGMAALGQGG